MKLPTLLFCFVSLSGTATQAAEDSLYYCKVEAGPAFLENIHVHMVNGGINNGDLKTKTGVRVDLIGGYNFNQYLAGELNIAMVRNELVDLGHTIYYQVPLMANVLGKYPMGKWQPYAGVGLGGVATIPDNRGQGQDDVDAVFGTQALAGLKYQITSHCSFDLSYKFLYAAAMHADARTELGPGLTHSFLAGISYHF